MGFSHQWYLSPDASPDAYAAALADIRTIIAASPIPPDNSSPGIRLHGFLLPENPGDLLRRPHPIWDPEHRRVFCDCKPYGSSHNAVVMAALTVLKDHLGEDIRVYSDYPSQDWEAGTQLAASVLGRSFACPLQ